MGRIFGLTGGIASGKSTVARFLQALGAQVIDADGVGHELLHPPNPVYNKVVSHFGREILNPSGEIDRGRLGSIVFGDPWKLSELNSIVHPGLHCTRRGACSGVSRPARSSCNRCGCGADL